MTVVYFIECQAVGAIKIGTSKQVDRRLRMLQGANAAELKLLLVVPGNQYDEEELHERFASEWIRGEWFRSGGALGAFVTALLLMSEKKRIAALDTRTDRLERIDAFARHTGRGNSYDRMEPRR